jgi:hypothetical protein
MDALSPIVFIRNLRRNAFHSGASLIVGFGRLLARILSRITFRALRTVGLERLYCLASACSVQLSSCVAVIFPSRRSPFIAVMTSQYAVGRRPGFRGLCSGAVDLMTLAGPLSGEFFG